MSKRLAVVLCAGLISPAVAQDFSGQPIPQAFEGAASIGSQEQLFPFDDQEPWKHGYRQVMPYYGGYHKYRPYNYHHVFGQTQTAASYGLPMPYSQQFWHRYQSVPGGNMLQYPAYNWNNTPIGQYPPTVDAAQQWTPPAPLSPQAAAPVEQPAPSTGDAFYIPPPPAALPRTP